MTLLSGVAEGIPYSLSRWTDLPRSKWGWFEACLKSNKMVAFDPRTTAPGVWSLAPEDTLGLVFWTKNPTNLILSQKALSEYEVTVHMTATGWAEVEKGAPSLQEAGKLLVRASQAFSTVYWRFSPVPLLPEAELFRRFQRLLGYASIAGLNQVFVSFLQPNDKLPETRSVSERFDLLNVLSEEAKEFGVKVVLCRDDRTLGACQGAHQFETGACVDPVDFGGQGKVHLENCGCVLMVDPFTLNESCHYACSYCLAPETPVLFSDYVWRPLSEVKIGDQLLAFDEKPPGYRKDRKFRTATVEAVWASLQPTIELVAGTCSVITTPNHKWLEGKSKKVWKPTQHLSLDSVLHQIDVTPNYEFTRDYGLGYIAGMTAGDGTFRYTPGQNSRQPNQPYWRVALVDMEPLYRLKKFLTFLDVTVELKPFDAGQSGFKGTRPMFKVETRALQALSSIHALLSTEYDSFDFKRGFLAGVFDAEGSYSKSNLRIHQTKVNGLLEKIERYARALGVTFSREVKASRMTGSLREKIRFFSILRPALTGKTTALIGRCFDFQHAPVSSIRQGPLREMLDIQTSTGTFIAGGLGTHNCYAADKSLSVRKRNTTRQRLVQVR
jgi:hypothetical protein